MSDKCCYYLKEKPCNDYARETGRFPYMGLMASEGGRRQKALMLHGCNYISPGTKRSCPLQFSPGRICCSWPLIFTCRFRRFMAISCGIRMEPCGPQRPSGQGAACVGSESTWKSAPHRFDLLWESNPKEWEMWMYHVCQDANGAWYGWGHVLDYIGVEWRDPWFLFGQLSFNFGQEKSHDE